MKGLIFNLLEEFLVARCGEAEYGRILEGCKLDTADPLLMVAPGSYADQDFLVIAGEAAKRLKISPDQLMQDFGRAAISGLVTRYPQFFAQCSHPRDFLVSLNYIHCVEVRKLYHEASPPRFQSEDISGGGLRISYISSRCLCPLLAGLLEGVAEYYQTFMRQRHTACMREGQPACLFEIDFNGAG